MKLKRSYKLDAPKGVRGRNSDNTLIKQKLGLGAVHPPARRHGEDLPLDLRPDGDPASAPPRLRLRGTGAGW